MKSKVLNNRNKLICLCLLLFILIFLYVFLVLLNIHSLSKYKDTILPNTYIGEFDVSGYSYKNVKNKINFYNDYILSKKLKLIINSKDYEYSLKDLGFSIDADGIINDIKEYQSDLNYTKKLRIINGRGDKKIFQYSFDCDNEVLNNQLNTLKSIIDVSAINGYFDVTNGVHYNNGIDGFIFDVSKSSQIINDIFSKSVSIDDLSIELVGDVIESESNESYSQIDTMVSSFVTKFNVWEGTRPINLRTALNYIDGAIVEPGNIFSYYEYAGPYNKSGYVFYYEFVGNGVCQIATTVYNAALLGGLEIVKRYPHAKKSVYVDGGLDATVASYSSGWNVDFQFKNTYQYPIYIKAYAVGGEAHVEFWSNSNAKEGKTYSTESVWLGGRGYTTYLHTYKDGVEIDKSKIATTWYIED